MSAENSVRAVVPNIHEEIDNRLSYHLPTPETTQVHIDTRIRFQNLAHWVADNVPAGRHQSLALTAVQEALLWSNCAIACDTKDVA